MQLDALLRSIDDHLSGSFSRISVLYTSSNDGFKRAYAEMRDNWRTYVHFIKEQNFLDDTIRLAETKLKRTQAQPDCIAFMVDDDIVARPLPISLEELQEQLADLKPQGRKLRNQKLSFSLRLGMNITVGKLPQTHTRKDQIMTWQPAHAVKHFSWPFSLDGHFYDARLITSRLKQFNKCANPNKLEVYLQRQFENRTSDKAKKMSSLRQSILFGMPLNVTSATTNTSYGDKYHYSPDQLNKWYLQGYRIDLASLYKIANRHVNKNVHQEMPLKFHQ